MTVADDSFVVFVESYKVKPETSNYSERSTKLAQEQHFHLEGEINHFGCILSNKAQICLARSFYVADKIIILPNE